MDKIAKDLQAEIPDVLKHINETKAEHVAARKSVVSHDDLLEQAKNAEAPRGFLKALRARQAEDRFALIAELKKASPSKGLIREDFEPAKLAKAYEDGGATCLSVLTDTPFFQGQDAYLEQVKATVALPCLRKDFMIDTWQVTESRALGADCILIIMASLDDALAADIEAAAIEHGMDALIEVHNEAELERALTHLKSDLIGVNNRDLVRLETDLGTTERLADMVPEDKLMVSESGLFEHADLQRMSKVGAHSFLIGESLMRNEDVTAATKAVLGE